MTDIDLKAIRARAETFRQMTQGGTHAGARFAGRSSAADVPALLAEVDRLRAELDRRQAVVDAAEQLVASHRIDTGTWVDTDRIQGDALQQLADALEALNGDPTENPIVAKFYAGMAEQVRRDLVDEFGPKAGA